jgi:hypothetical protein
LQQPSPFCHPERSRISYFTALTGATYVVLFKENHMQLTEAATLDRKSGVAEGPAVRPSVAPTSKGVTESVPRPPVGRCFSFSPTYLWDNEATLAFELAAAPGIPWQAASTAKIPDEATQTGIDADSQPSPE